MKKIMIINTRNEFFDHFSECSFLVFVYCINSFRTNIFLTTKINLNFLMNYTFVKTFHYFKNLFTFGTTKREAF